MSIQDSVQFCVGIINYSLPLALIIGVSAFACRTIVGMFTGRGIRF